MGKLKVKNTDGNIWLPVTENGIGVPSGGTAGQLLAKSSDSDYATQWIDKPDKVYITGYAINPVDNLNDYQSGISFISQGTNTPPSSWSLIVGASANTNRLDIAYDYENKKGIQYRKMANGTWSNWRPYAVGRIYESESGEMSFTIDLSEYILGSAGFTQLLVASNSWSTTQAEHSSLYYIVAIQGGLYISALPIYAPTNSPTVTATNNSKIITITKSVDIKVITSVTPLGIYGE